MKNSQNVKVLLNFCIVKEPKNYNYFSHIVKYYLTYSSQCVKI
jgi:hypothetical protein